MTYSPLYRKIFPSYDWDEDVWRVNQIINLPKILDCENAGFMKNVPNEEVKKDDRAIARWINENMEGCSCLVVFVGEKTYLSKWVKYEIDLARERKMGRFIIYLTGLKNTSGEKCSKGIDPYKAHGLYADNPSPENYVIKQYSWLKDNGLENFSDWIEDACRRAGR